MLCWEGSGPLDCNSNDGKRSEWVNIVRVGDLVQLLPECLEESLMDFMEMKNLEDEKVVNIYGFSSRSRLGRWGVTPLLSANGRRKISEFNECHEMKRGRTQRG